MEAFAPQLALQNTYDLLDHINPNQENRGRDSESGKRRNSSIKVLANSNESLSLASPEISPRDSVSAITVEKMQINELQLSQDDNANIMSQIEASMEHLSPTEQLVEAAKVKITLLKVEPEDGCQPVQRPKSAGGSGKQIKHYRPSNRKVYDPPSEAPTYNSQYKARNSYSNNQYYFLRKITVGHATYTDHQQHVKAQTSSARFGRKMYKAMSYWIKPGTASTEAPDTSKSTGEQMSAKVESLVT